MNLSFAPRLIVYLLASFLLAVPASFGAPVPNIASPPLGERWFSVNMGGERVGFAHQTIAPKDGGYLITSDGSVKMVVMGVSREASSKEAYTVGPDLSLKSFDVEQHMDGSPMRVKGEVRPGGIKVVVESGGKKKERTLKVKGSVFPPQALNIYPLMHDADKGKKYRIQMLDPEAVKVKEVKVEVVGQETISPGTPTLHLKNNLFPVVDNDIWVDLKANTIKESVRDDLVVTLAEEKTTAKEHLADAALSKKDLVLDFSLIKTDPIRSPAQLKLLVMEFSGIPPTFPLPEGDRQSATRLAGEKVRFSMPAAAGTAATRETRPEDLEPSARIPSDDPEIVAQMKAILGETGDLGEAMPKLVAWVSKEIKGTVTDSHSPLETLRKRNGNCQSHARLYAALARSAGIPTRFVSGIVYSPGQGFLYHSWAESYVGKRWVPVDPTFGEVPANLTHIKLVEGDSPDEMAQLAGVIGKIKGNVIQQVY